MGKISSIDTMGLVDGPGIRFVVFMQGCKNRCIYCHNPETFNINDGTEMTSDELIRKILKYKNYFNDNGGVTFSGGEPLLQKDFLLEMLKLCKTCNIHTCLDTSGIGVGNYEEILKYTDLVLLDIKGITDKEFFEIAKHKKDEFDNFLNVCQKLNKKLWIRHVIIPGINDTEDYIIRFKEYIKNINNIEKVQLLPYHSMAIEKYEKLGLEYPLKNVLDMDIEKVQQLQEILDN